MATRHRFAALSFTVALALAGVVALLWLLGGSTPSAHADSPHYVALDCTGVPAPCHTTIQEAVDAAVSGDEIRVASGDYTGVQGRAAPAGYDGPSVITQVVYISKTVTIRGGYTTAFSEPPDPETNQTTLDAREQGRVFFITGDPSAGSGQAISPTIEGLRFTGGDAAGLGGEVGGVMLAAGCTSSAPRPPSGTTRCSATLPSAAAGCTSSPPRLPLGTTGYSATPPITAAAGCT